MDPIAGKHSMWRRLVHKFQARRDIPFRKKFFVGYDLHGNTYWEFTIDGNMQRLRRKLEPYQESYFKSDYFETVPPQWLQWLRRMKRDPPTLQELVDDQIRQQRIKLLAMQADQKWTLEKDRQENEQQMRLQAELDRVKQESAQFAAAHESEDPWAQTDAENKPDAKNPWADADAQAGRDPIQSASIKPRK